MPEPPKPDRLLPLVDEIRKTIPPAVTAPAPKQKPRTYVPFNPPAPTPQTQIYDAYAGIEHPVSVALGNTFDIKAWIRWQHPKLPMTGDIKVSISQVHVTPLMKVAMESTPGAFTIEGPPTPIQHVPLTPEGSTDWTFKLRALKSGNYTLTVHFSYVSAEGGVVAPAETFDQTRTIEVQVLSWWGRMKAAVYRTWNYYNTNAFFKWILNTLGGLLSLESLRRAWGWFKNKKEGVSQA